MWKAYALGKRQKKLTAGESGMLDTYWLEVFAVGKRHKSGGYQAWIPANEYISASLGTFLGLPIPPFSMLSSKNGDETDLWFSSLDYRLDGEALPAIDPETVFDHDPSTCAGVAVFDLWIANVGRHDKNLSFDYSTSPKRLNVFDHSHALFGLEGAQRLERLMDSFTLAETAETNAIRHCLIDQIDKFDLFRPWVDRVSQLPEFQIIDVCTQAKELGIIDDDERGKVIDFLLYRRTIVSDLLLKNQNQFPAIKHTHHLI